MTGFRKISVLAALFTLAGCSGPLSTLDPAGPSAAAIATLWWVMFWAAVVLFVLVVGILAMIWFRPGFGSRFAPMRWIVYGGLAMPGVVLTALVSYSLVTGERLLPHALADAPPRVSAHGTMWQWQFSYPDLPGTTQTRVLHIPAGEPVDVLVTSGDVIHSFWVPRLAGKIDAIPGHENTIRIQADRPGSYQGVCAEFCGSGHTQMRFQVEAHTPEEYEAAVRDAAQ